MAVANFILAPNYPPTFCFVMLGKDYACSISALATGCLLSFDNSGRKRETRCLKEKERDVILSSVSSFISLPVCFTRTTFPHLST